MKTENRRKLLACLLAAMMLIGSLTMTGCGNNDAKTSDEQTAPAATEVAEEAESQEATTESQEATTQTTETTKATESTKKASQQTKKSSKQQTKVATKATQAASTCSVSVDGYCSNKKITVKSGDTAYSVLKKTGASVSARNSQFGLYVEGINGRFEFDEGDTSGWKYSVNGSTPSKSCDKITVKQGDKIKWYYVK